MAKDKTGNNDDSGRVVGANKKIAESLREISNQASVFDVLASGVAKLREELEEASEVLSEQTEKLKVFGDLAASMEKSSKSASQLSSAVSKQTKDVKKLADAYGFKKSGSGYADNKNIFEDMGKSSSKAAKIGIIALQGAMKTLSSVGKGVSGVLSGVVSVIGSMIETIVSFAKGVFNLFVELYEGLFETAKQYRQGTVEYMREVENVREKFGDVTRGIGKSVVAMGKQVYAAGAAGLSGFQLFEDRADALRKMSELAEAGGAAFELLIDQFSGKNLSDIYAFKEGLGLTNDELAGMTRYAVATGRPVKGLLMEIHKYARGLSEQFGGTAQAFKSIARDVTKARMDVRHFGNVATPALAAASAYARKLGVELEKITGIMDAFDTFDTAAENVAKLSQAFGVNLDTMQLMNAQTSAEQLDTVRQAFFAAGKSADNMNRYQLKYLAQTLQMDEATVQQTLSLNNQGKSMDELQNSTKTMEHQMISTAEALRDVMGEIKVVVRELAQITSKGFFGTFFEGFTEGIARSAPFRNMMLSWAQAIQQVWHAGRRLGIMFVEYFPGVKDMLQGLAKIMPRVSEMFNKFGEVLTDFFKGLESGQANVGELLGKMWDDMTKFFDELDPQFARGAGKFFETIGKIMQATLVFLVDKAAELISSLFEAIADYLDSNDLSDAMGGAASAAGRGFSKAFKKAKDFSEPILAAFGRAMDKIGPQLNRLWEHLKKGLDKFFEEYKWEIFMFKWGSVISTGLQIAFSSPKVTGAISALASKMNSALGGFGGLVMGGITTAITAGIAIYQSRMKTILTASQQRQMSQTFADLESRVKVAAEKGDETEKKRLQEELISAREKAMASVGQTYGVVGGLTEDLGARKATLEYFERLGGLLDKVADSATRAKDAESLRQQTLEAVQKAGFKTIEDFEKFRDTSSATGTARDIGENILGLFGLSEQAMGGPSFTEAWTRVAAGIGGDFDQAILAYKAFMDAKGKDVGMVVTEQAKKQQTEEEKRLEEGQRAIEETVSQIGETTIDNVEERIQKIKEIGAKIYGNEETFNAETKKVRESLAKFDFMIMDEETNKKFTMNVAKFDAVLGMFDKIKKIIASIDDISQAAVGLGAINQPDSILGQFVNGLITFKTGMVDIVTLFRGGKLSDGRNVIRGLGVGKEDLKAIEAFAKDDLTPFVGSLKILEGGVNAVKSTFDSITGAFNAMINSDPTNTMINWAISMRDFMTIFRGGTFSNGTAWTEGLSVPPEDKMAIEGFASQLDDLALKMDTLLGSMSRVQQKILEIRGLSEQFTANFVADDALTMAASGNFVGGVDSIIKSVSALKAQAATVLATTDANVTANMEKLKDSLEGKGEYSIKTAPVNLTLRVNVKMKADAVEEVILSQEKSLIMHTFNELGQLGGEKAEFNYQKDRTPWKVDKATVQGNDG